MFAPTSVWVAPFGAFSFVMVHRKRRSPVRESYIAALWNDSPWIDVFAHVDVFVHVSAFGEAAPDMWSKSWLFELCRALVGEEPRDRLLPFSTHPLRANERPT